MIPVLRGSKLGLHAIQPGGKFGRWTVVEKRGMRGAHRMWLCRCICGKEREVFRSALTSGISTSCGCSRKSDGTASFRVLLRRYRHDAKQKEREWLILESDARILMQEPCHYCGAPPLRVVRAKETNVEFLYNGLDRVDNDRGYIPGNVVPCCGDCNRAKRGMTAGKFASWIARVYHNSPDMWIESVT